MAMHRQSLPTIAAPPPELKALSRKLSRHPDIAQAGLTTTSDGRWALMLWLRKSSNLTPDDIEQLAEGFPVVLEAEPDFPPIARPAFPARGE